MEAKNIPNHVGIIMDGNGRWAEKRGKKRSYGHKQGSKNVDRVVTYAFKRGIKTLTLYAFSSENWARPKEEVDELMKLLKIYFTKFLGKVVKNGVKLKVIGGREELSLDLIEVIEKAERESENNTDHALVIAINYGGRQEVVNAVKKLISKGEEITVEGISNNLYTAEFGEPDLIIRTGGELRTSNFLLYQGAYSELYFTNALWPDFDENELEQAIDSYSSRQRRFGKVL
jgi:undecaprenyl diphosphate synthase